MKSRHLSSGYLINSACLLLILSVYFTSTLVQSVDPYELKNWIEFTKDKWPVSDAQSKAPFLVFHSEYVNGNILGLKKGIWNGSETWLTNPDLSFRYWVSEQAYFRSRKNSQTPPKIDLKLTGSSWESSISLQNNAKTSLKSISKDEWEQFGFENSDIFTMGIKDVSVKYVEKIDTSKTSLITAYPTTAEGFKSVNFSDPEDVTSGSGSANAIPNDPNIDSTGTKLLFSGKPHKFNLGKLGFKTITFKCEQDTKTVDTVKITLKSATECKVEDKNNLFKNTQCKNNVIDVLQTETTANKFVLSEFKVSKDATQAKDESVNVLLTNIEQPITPHNNGKTLKYKIDPKIIPLTTFSQIKGYIRFNSTTATGADVGKDICYTISKTDAVQNVGNSIDVYLTLEGAKTGFKLDTISDNKPSKNICLFNYVALQNIGNYIITLTVQGEITDKFSINVATNFGKKTVDYTLAPPESDDVLASPQWFYYNSMFKNVLKSQDSNAELYACDVISSCYPLIQNEIDQSNFELPEQLTNELKKSPFFQIRGSIMSGKKVSFINTLNAQSQTVFNKVFLEENAQSLTEDTVNKAKTTPTASNSYYLTFNNGDNTSLITLPLDSIDMRFQKLTIKIDLVSKTDGSPLKRTDDPKSELLLNLITLKNSKNEFSFSPDSIVKTAKIAFDTLKITSSDFFFVKSTKISTGNKIILKLQLNADAPAKPVPLVKVQFTVDSFKQTDQNIFSNPKADKKQLKLLPKGQVDAFTLEKSKSKLIVTDFINNADNAVLSKVNLKFALTITSKDATKPENYSVYRVIVDQNLTPTKYESISGSLDSSKKVVTFSDSSKDTDTQEIKGPFRVLYFIHSLPQNSDKVNVAVTSFSLDVQKTTDQDNTKVTQSLAHVNLEYEKAVCVYGNTNIINKVCQLPDIINQITEIKCDMAAGCNNIFDRQLPTSTQIGPVDNIKMRFAPFQLDESKTEKRQLIINRKLPTATPAPDFCVDFYYLAKTTSLSIVSDAAIKNVIELPLTPDNKEKTLMTKVCASHFTNNVAAVNKLIFSFDNHKELDIDNHYVEITKTQIDNQNSSPNINLVLNTGIYLSNLAKNQFFDSNNWATTFDLKSFSNLLTYKISSAELNNLKANSKNGTINFYYETLRTRWIKMPKVYAVLKYGLFFNKSNVDSYTNSLVIDSKTVVRLISSKQTGIKAPLSKYNDDTITVLDKSLPDEHYMLEIDVTLNMTEIEKLKKDKKLTSDLVLKIENFNINDPCIVGESLTTLEKCNSKEGFQDKQHNYCERGYNETDFRPICQCTDSFTGPGCVNENYCKTQGFTLCGREDRCHNDDIFKQVKCDCSGDEKWNPFLKGCINSAELTKCGPNRRPQLTLVPRGVKCVCLDDYVEMSINATSTDCVPIEPCNEKHRTKLGFKTACPNANAKCEPTGSKTSPTDFKCKCADSYINQNGVFSSDAKCLPNVCAQCPSSCKLDNKVYKCDTAFCDPNGYNYNKITKKCEFDADQFAKLLNCESGTKAEIGADGKPACKCAVGQKLDSISRKCSKTECDDKAIDACKARGAPICKFDSGKAQCSCSSTSIAYATEQVNASDWKCISKCSLLDKPDYYEARCSNSFEHCNEKANIKLTPLKEIENHVNAPYTKNIVVYNYTKVDFSGAGQKSYCACNLGFLRDTKTSKCFPSTIPTHTISNFEFDLIHTHDLVGYIDKVSKAFVNLVATVVGIKKGDPAYDSLTSATKCVKDTETTILCKTSFQSTLTNEEIIKRFAAACIQAKDDKSKCFYIPNPTNFFYSNFLTKSAFNDDSGLSTFAGTSDSDVLIHNSNAKPSVTQEDYCSKDKNTCSSYANSVCKNDKTKPFECLCPISKETPLFKVKNALKLTLTAENNKKVNLQMETCEPLNLCEAYKEKFGCQSKDALCHSQVELNEKKDGYNGISYCTCPKTGITLSDRSLSCESTCNGWCSKNTASCVQDYLNTKKIVCSCKDGFTGEKCEKSAPTAKKEAEASSSKAYLISTIVVSVIAAIALIGLAVLYFKRR